MEIKDELAYQLIKTEKIKIRDCFINKVEVCIGSETGVIISLSEKYLDKIKNNITIYLFNLQEIRYNYFIDDPRYLEDYKINYDVGVGLFYLSLDPDNSSENPCENDCNIFISKNISIKIT